MIKYLLKFSISLFITLLVYDTVMFVAQRMGTRRHQLLTVKRDMLQFEEPELFLPQKLALPLELGSPALYGSAGAVFVALALSMLYRKLTKPVAGDTSSNSNSNSSSSSNSSSKTGNGDLGQRQEDKTRLLIIQGEAVYSCSSTGLQLAEGLTSESKTSELSSLYEDVMSQNLIDFLFIKPPKESQVNQLAESKMDTSAEVGEMTLASHESTSEAEKEAEKSSTEEAAKPSTEEAEKPSPGEAEKPSPGETEKPSPGEAEKPSTEETEKASTEEAEKSSPEEVAKPSTEEAEKPSTEEAEKPSTEEAEKPSTEEAEKTSSEEAEKPTPEEAVLEIACEEIVGTSEVEVNTESIEDLFKESFERLEVKYSLVEERLMVVEEQALDCIRRINELENIEEKLEKRMDMADTELAGLHQEVCTFLTKLEDKQKEHYIMLTAMTKEAAMLEQDAMNGIFDVETTMMKCVAQGYLMNANGGSVRSIKTTNRSLHDLLKCSEEPLSENRTNKVIQQYSEESIKNSSEVSNCLEGSSKYIYNTKLCDEASINVNGMMKNSREEAKKNVDAYEENIELLRRHLDSLNASLMSKSHNELINNTADLIPVTEEIPLNHEIILKGETPLKDISCTNKLWLKGNMNHKKPAIKEKSTEVEMNLLLVQNMEEDNSILMNSMNHDRKQEEHICSATTCTYTPSHRSIGLDAMSNDFPMKKCRTPLKKITFKVPPHIVPPHKKTASVSTDSMADIRKVAQRMRAAREKQTFR